MAPWQYTTYWVKPYTSCHFLRPSSTDIPGVYVHFHSSSCRSDAWWLIQPGGLFPCYLWIGLRSLACFCSRREICTGTRPWRRRKQGQIVFVYFLWFSSWAVRSGQPWRRSWRLETCRQMDYHPVWSFQWTRPNSNLYREPWSPQIFGIHQRNR